MQSAGDFLEIIGLMAVLISGAIVFVTLAQWLAGKRRNRITLGAQMSAFFGLLYLLADEVLAVLGQPALSTDITRMVAALFWLSLAFGINAGIDKWVWHGALTRRGEPLMPKLLTDAVTVLVYLAAIMIVMHFVYGEPITALVATSGAVAFILGYSAQTTLGELFSGVSLQVSRAVKKGDEVLIGDVFGRVHDVDWRSVSVKQYLTNSLVVFPNSVLATKEFCNYSAPDNIIQVHADITVEFSAPPDLVVRALTEALAAMRVILRDPEPLVYTLGQRDFGTAYRMLWMIDTTDDWFPSLTEAHSAAWSALRKYGIKPALNHQFAGPGSQFDENAWPLRNTSLEVEVAALRASPFLAPLNDSDFAALMDRAARRDFVPPDIISGPATPNDTFDLVAVGRAAADLPYVEAGEEMFIANELIPGEPIGLRAFRDGGARRETVQCLDYAVIYSFPRDQIIQLAAKYPEIDATIEAEISARDAEAERRRKAHAVESARRVRLTTKRDIADGLSGRLGSLLKGGLMRRGPSKDRVADAAMAAAALVAAADGEIEAAERDAVIETFKDLDLFRFIDADAGLANFDAHCDRLVRNGDEGAEMALDAVRKIAAHPALAEMIVDIAVAISAADGEVEEPEERRISDIRSALRLDDRKIG